MDLEQVNLRSLIDIDELKYLLNDFSDMTGFKIGLADVFTNEFLLKVGSRDICTEFYRTHPESEAYCEEGNKRLTAGLKHAGEIRIDRCANGLINACTPIVVRGKHLANLFAGQVLFSPPDLERFKSQAQKYGYDEQRYLENLIKVPVVDEKRTLSILRYLSKKITFITQTKLDLLCSNSEYMKHKDMLPQITDLAPVGIGIAHNRTIQWANRAMSQLTGYSNEELTGMKGETLYPSAEAFALSGEKIKNQFRSGRTAARETQWKAKDGSLIEVYVSSAPLNYDVPSEKTIFTALDITELKRSQRRLEQNEERITLVFNAANLGLWDWNICTGEVFFNDNYFSMLGYKPDTFPQNLETWKMLLHPEDREKAVNTILSSLSETDPSWNIEFRMLSATGDYRWILGQGKVFEFTQDGMPRRATGIHQDITRQKSDEQNLLNKEQKYRELFNNMSSGVAIFSAIENGDCFVIDDLNSAFLKTIQIELEKVVGLEISEILPQIEVTGVLDVFKRVYKTGISETLLARHYKDENFELWADIYVFSLSSGQIATIYNNFTEQKLAKLDLENRQAEFAQALDLAADAFCLGDANGIIIDVNQQTVVLTGYSRDELLGQHVNFLFSKAGLKKSPLNFSLLRTGGVLMREREIAHKNGTIIPVELHSKKMPNGMFQSFIRDITERKYLQKALLTSQRDLQKKKLQLVETNTALKILIRQVEQEKLELEESIAANILSLVEPHLKKLKTSKINKSQANHIEIIEATLNNLVSPFVRTTVAMSLKLSPAEIQVANLIKQGKTSKQIAELLGLSSQTIDKHRSHIRKKIGVTNKDISLRELLTSRS